MSTRLIHVVASGRISFLLWSSRSLLFRKHSLGTTQVPGLHHTSEMQRGVRQSPHSCGTYFAARKAESTDATVGRGRAAASVVACMSPVVHSTPGIHLRYRHGLIPTCLFVAVPHLTSLSHNVTIIKEEPAGFQRVEWAGFSALSPQMSRHSLWLIRG